MSRKTDEEILEEYASKMNLVVVEDTRRILLRVVRKARKDEPKINSGRNIIDWMDMHEDAASMEECYGQDYFDDSSCGPEEIYGITDTKTGLCVSFGRVEGDSECPSWHERNSDLSDRFSLADCKVVLSDLRRWGYLAERFVWEDDQ